MSLAAESKQKLIAKYARSKNDTASAPVQIALLTQRLQELNAHFKTHKKDHHSRRGLLKLVGQRRKLMNYYFRKDPAGYEKLVADLGIRG